MSSRTIVTFTGWKAVLCLVALVAFSGFRWMTATSKLDTQGREVLTQWVRLELARPVLDDPALPLEERGELVNATMEVHIRSIAARGPLDDVVVKVELEPGPGVPQDEELIRFYRLSYSSLLGWTDPRRTRSSSWWLALI